MSVEDGVPVLEVWCGGAADPQAQLPLATDGVRRVIWHLAMGPILIEVRDGDVFVNGQRVEPLAETLRPVGDP